MLESSPEATGEEARVGGVAAGQLQGEGGVVHVAVRQQHQAPGASGGWQQTEAAQGPPQLSAAPHWYGDLMTRAAGHKLADTQTH